MVIGPLTSPEVVALIANGEDSFTEFKSAATSPRDVAKELCAFLNTGGGRVLIGVEGDGQVTGLGDWTEERAMNLARTILDPPVIPTWQVLDVTASHVAVLSVDLGPEKPYAVGGGEGKRYYIRAGTTSREASREDLIRLTQASGAVQPDLRPVIGASIVDLDNAALEERFGQRRSLDWDGLSDGERSKVLVNAEILHAATLTPTVGGLLCFGRRPPERLPQAALSCVAYPGTRPDREIIDRETYDRRVDQQVRDAAAFVRRNLRTPSDVRQLDRIDAPRPSDESIRELVANAVAHRDYGIAAPVQLRVFADRLEIVSPGPLPNGVTPEAMRVGVSVRRNPFIVQYLLERHVMDALGRGMVLVVEECLDLGLPEPDIKTPEGFVVVTLSWSDAEPV